MNRKELNEDFFREEVWVHYRYISKFLYTLTLDSNLTDDLSQDTMFLCWRKVERMKKYGNIKAALTKIARNEYNQYYRRKSRLAEELVDPMQIWRMAECSNIEDYIRKEKDGHELLLLFTGIKREYVQVVLLTDYYDFSLKEVADMLKKNYSTVATYHSRGLHEMRKRKDIYEKLQERGGAYE